MFRSVYKAYGLNENSTAIIPFGNGLINQTWRINTGNVSYILQKVNTSVFKKPEDIAYNVSLIGEYLKQHNPDYFFVGAIKSTNGNEMIFLKDEGFFRLFSFVSDSHSKDVVKTPEQAYEAAAQFGKFTWLLSDFDPAKLKIIIPEFHNLTLRYQQFLQTLQTGNKKRISESGELIKMLIAHSDIVLKYENIKANPQFKLRVTHHDTKISNVLFNSEGKGICVIDLDTVMPGYFISDVGDMMRTYLSPVSEEEKDFDKIFIREDFYKAIVKGYYNEMKEVLTEAERNSFFYSGKIMIYMQALRFLTDHLNDDIYYGIKYAGHNFVRANNQLILLQRLIEKAPSLKNWNS